MALSADLIIQAALAQGLTRADLLWRVFGVVGFACPCCSQTMTLRAVVLPPATLGVLASLERSARAPPRGTEGA